MKHVKPTTFEKASFKLSQWMDTPNNFDLTDIGWKPQGGRSRTRMKIWGKRLELFFGFIPALLVFMITYGKKFR